MFYYYDWTSLIGILLIVSMWKLFLKADKPGWASIIPIYNTLVLLDIAGKPWWWIFLFLIPIANIVFIIITYLDMAKAFGKDGAFGFFLLVLFPFVGFPILAFGDAKYSKRATATTNNESDEKTKEIK